MGERSSRPGMVLAATAIMVVAGTTAAWLAKRPDATAPHETITPTATSTGTPTDTPNAGPATADPFGQAPSDAPAGAETAATPGTDPAEAAPPELQAPAFDVVRVEPDGKAAVVGKAEPGAKVTIFADGKPVSTAEADSQGNFVALFSVEPSAAPRALTLGAETADGQVTSKDVVMLLPQTSEVASADIAAAEPAAPRALASPALASPTVAATAIVRDAGVEVLPPPGDPAAKRPVTLGSISYGAAGDVRLSGVGTAGSVIRIYVDDRFAQEVHVAADGRWQAGLGDVAQGLYRLRVDQLGPDGTVASRIETPFQRDLPPPPRPGSVSPPVDSGTGPVARIELTVQPGNNLWTIARNHYGSGVEYTKIFTANRDLIRDPDLIYPGQIFRMPDGTVTTGTDGTTVE
ncbi:nucleoid-associated protein YgaU [Amaricoccus macauensis]|uniref:Nucleoid-associated protein YgaU n=1 Tax=Amaricoccus macauensis TaxID=57001 RepID=A0A840SR22_9RHOB|nr:Ig-like domain-containing protein [Amaricoccus macauensis]MBB5223015.1 nucleoid-associated protein YgaU [Amaricoccus macauensis]